MPSFTINSGAIASLTLLGKHENQEVMSVFHYKLLMSGPTDEGADLMTEFLNNALGAGDILDKWRDCLSVKVSALRAQGQWIHPARYAYEERFTIPGAGTVAGDAYPVNTSVAITKRTMAAGRNQVRTLHMPGVPISFVTNGAVTLAGQTAYQGLMDVIIAPITTAVIPATFNPVLFRRADPVNSPYNTQCSLKPTARVERRRTVGLGS